MHFGTTCICKDGEIVFRGTLDEVIKKLESKKYVVEAAIKTGAEVKGFQVMNYGQSKKLWKDKIELENWEGCLKCLLEYGNTCITYHHENFEKWLTEKGIKFSVDKREIRKSNHISINGNKTIRTKKEKPLYVYELR